MSTNIFNRILKQFKLGKVLKHESYYPSRVFQKYFFYMENFKQKLVLPLQLLKLLKFGHISLHFLNKFLNSNLNFRHIIKLENVNLSCGLILPFNGQISPQDKFTFLK